MASTTYTAFAPAVDTTALVEKSQTVGAKILEVLKVAIGIYADQHSAYRGLDLNGNAMWVARPTH